MTSGGAEVSTDGPTGRVTLCDCDCVQCYETATSVEERLSLASQGSLGVRAGAMSRYLDVTSLSTPSVYKDTAVAAAVGPCCTASKLNRVWTVSLLHAA